MYFQQSVIWSIHVNKWYLLKGVFYTCEDVENCKLNESGQLSDIQKN